MGISINQKRKYAVVLIFIGYLLLGIFKSSVLKVYNSAGVLIAEQESPLSVGGIIDKTTTDPRWYFNLLVIVVYVIFGSFVVWYCFRERKITQLVLITYLSLVLVCFMLIGVDLIAGRMVFGYETARAIKDYLIQTPFLVLVIISGQYLFYRKKLLQYLDPVDKLS